MVLLTILTADTPMTTRVPCPTVISWMNTIYCEVKTNDPRVHIFVFDPEVDVVDVVDIGDWFQILSIGNLTATHNERYLFGRLNKVVRFGSVYKLCTVCNTQFIVTL